MPANTPTIRQRSLVMALVALLLPCLASAKVERFEARDTLDVAAIPAATEDEAAAIAGIEWQPALFQVTAMTAPADAGDAFVFFPSPRPSGDAVIDRVSMEWFAARAPDGKVRRARAVLVVHTLHPAMPFSRAMAREISASGVHAFVVHMPGYGMRVADPDGPSGSPGVVALTHSVQAVADIRRAHDAIRALPNIADEPIGLVGMSLGGFAAATAGALDGAFSPVALFISGGNGARVLREGAMDARFLHEAIEAHGYRGDRLDALLWPAEPLRVARRLDPDETWLVAAANDRVIPSWSSDALAQAAKLSRATRHYVAWAGNHYTFVIWVPGAAAHVLNLLQLSPPTPAPAK